MQADMVKDFNYVQQRLDDIVIESCMSMSSREGWIEAFETFADLATNYDEIEFCGLQIDLLKQMRGKGN